MPNQNFYVDEGNFVRFDLFDIVNAPSIQESDSFELTFYEFDDPIMTITQGVTITATPGELSNMQVVPEGFRVRDLVPYSFGFVTSNRVFQDGTIKIEVPTEIEVIESELAITPVTTISEDGSVSLSYDELSHSILVQNPFPQDFNTAQLVEFIISAGLKNAESTEPISSFTIETLDSTGSIIDAG